MEKDLLLSWLNDAYAMERSLMQVLERHRDQAEDYPRAQERIQQHMSETERHAEKIQGCIERLGGDTSAMKSAMGDIAGRLQGMGGRNRDQLLKNMIDEYATEHMEIATYKSLIVAAHDVGDMDTAAACEEILRDEENMVQWLGGEIGNATLEALRAEVAAEAARV